MKALLSAVVLAGAVVVSPGTASADPALDAACFDGPRGGRLAACRRLVAIDPKDTEAWIGLGDAHEAASDPDAARVAWGKAAAIEAKTARAFLMRATALERLWRREEATAAVERALKLQPDEPASLLLRSRLRGAAGDRAGATADLDRILTIDPRHRPALFARAKTAAENPDEGPDVATDYLLRAIAGEPDEAELLDTLLNGARPYRPPEALLRICDRIVAVVPKRAESWRQRGEILIGLARREDAIADFDRALSLDPRSVRALSARAAVLITLGREGEAERDLEAARAIVPDDPGVLTNLGGLRLLHDDDAAAKALFDRALAKDPTLVSALNMRAGIAIRSEDWPAALADLDRAVTLAGRDPLLLARRGLAHLGCRHGVEAWADVEAALVSGGDFAHVRFDHARVAVATGRLEAATQDLDAVERGARDGKSPPARSARELRLRRAEIAFLRGDFAASAATLAPGSGGTGALDEAVMRHVARLRAGSSDEAELAAAVDAAPGSDGAERRIAEFHLGRRPLADLLDTDLTPAWMCVVRFHQGERALAQGETATARGALTEAARLCSPTTVAATAAHAELERIAAAPPSKGH